MNRFISLALVLSLTGVVIWLASRPDAAPQQMPQLAGFAVEKVHTIEIKGHGPALTFSRNELGKGESSWQLLAGPEKKVAADSEAVIHLLNDLAAMTPIRVVTRNPEQYERLKVGTETTEVTLKERQGAVLFAVLIGKQGSDLLSTYIRLADKPEVLAVDRSLVWQVHRPLDGWKAKEAAPVGAASADTSGE